MTKARRLSPHPPNILVTKIGFDGHDRGSRLIAAYLRDAGMEVIYTPPWQPIPAVIEAHVAAFKRHKAERSNEAVRRGLDALAAAANSRDENVFAKVVEAAETGATNGEICACLRREMGFGHPLIVP